MMLSHHKIKLGGDKGGDSFKMNCQIANLLHPNSSHTTCVFSCYEADDIITNLHVALDRFWSEINNMGTAQWKQVPILIKTRLTNLN